MNHHEIEQQEIIERYVRHKLQPAERLAFQEHFFTCEACFAQVQSTATFIAGAQRSARVGVLADAAQEIAQSAAISYWSRWFKPLFALAATACLLLACTLGWLVFSRLPKLQTELARAQQTQTELAREKEQILQNSQTEIAKERERAAAEQTARTQLQKELAHQQTVAPVPNVLPKNSRPNADTETNVPLVILESTRSAKAQEPIAVPPQSKALTVWIEVEAGDRFTQFQMEIFTAQGQLRKTVAGLKPNAYGALAVRLPAQQFLAGKYLVKLYGVKNQQKELVGDYNLLLRN